jgi:uncharacterized damage-inducible protein DinB
MHNMMVLSPVWLYDCWENTRLSISQCLDLAPAEMLLWAPKEGMNTFEGLICHVCDIAEQWFYNVIKDGHAQSVCLFSSTDNKELLNARLLGILARGDKFVRSGNCYELYTSNGKSYSGTWILLHLYMHDVYHCGQLKGYLRLFGLTPPPWMEPQ